MHILDEYVCLCKPWIRVHCVVVARHCGHSGFWIRNPNVVFDSIFHFQHVLKTSFWFSTAIVRRQGGCFNLLAVGKHVAMHSHVPWDIYVSLSYITFIYAHTCRVHNQCYIPAHVFGIFNFFLLFPGIKLYFRICHCAEFHQKDCFK